MQLTVIVVVVVVLLLLLSAFRNKQRSPSFWRKQLQGKVVLITGASSGLGRACALAFHQAGCRLILSARNYDRLTKTKEAILSDGGNERDVQVLQMDLSDIDSLNEKAKCALEMYSQVDVLVNNGGVSSRSSVLDTNIAVDQQLMAVNYFGAVALTKALLPHMISKRSGHIVAISSVQGKLAIPFRSSYAASKHALEAFFESLRSEVVDFGVHVTLICPGYINTQLSVNAVTGDGAKYGVTDRSTQQGMSPEMVAANVVAATACHREELLLTTIDARAAVYLRTLCPFLLRKILRRRARKQKREQAANSKAE